jgi:hypothetical protein
MQKKPDKTIRGHGLSEIPAPDDELQFALWLTNLQMDVQSDPAHSDEQRQSLQQQFDALNDGIRTIEACDDMGLKGAVAKALYAAICIGALYPTSARMAPKIVGALNKARTQDATEAKRNVNFQSIIEQAARSLWEHKPGFRSKPTATGRDIYDDVARAVEAMPNKPNWWPRKTPNGGQPETESQAKVRRVEAIRRRVARVQ